MYKKLLFFIFISFSFRALGQSPDALSDNKAQLNSRSSGDSVARSVNDSSLTVSRNSVSKERLAEVALRGSGLRPEDIDFIKNFKQRFQKNLINLKNDKSVILKFIEYVLITNGIPRELKSLAVIESYLRNDAVSRVGAAGPWQFMPETASEYGLKIDEVNDERFDLYKSTYAAARFIQFLYAKYDDWKLVIAAYNVGTARLDKVIEKKGTSEFSEIQYLLPKETREHVKRFMATSYVMDSYVPDQSKKLREDMIGRYGRKGISVYEVNSGYNLSVIARELELPLEVVQELNSDFETVSAQNGSYLLKLPTDSMAEFMAMKAEILQQSLELRVQSSDLLNPEQNSLEP